MTWIRCAGTRSQCSESPGQGHRGVPNHSAKGSGPLCLCRMSLFPWPTAQWEQGTGSPAGMEGCCGSEVGPGGKMMLLLSRHILWGRLDPEAKARAQPSGLWVQWVLGPVRGGGNRREACQRPLLPFLPADVLHFLSGEQARDLPCQPSCAGSSCLHPAVCCPQRSLQQHRGSIWFLYCSSQGRKGLQTEVAVGGTVFSFFLFLLERLLL